MLLSGVLKNVLQGKENNIILSFSLKDYELSERERDCSVNWAIKEMALMEGSMVKLSGINNFQ